MKKRVGRPKKNGVLSFKVVKADAVDWTRATTPGKYLQIYEAVRDLRIGQALEVASESQNLAANVRYYVAKRCKGNYKIAAVHLKKAGIWYFKKEA